MSNDTDTPEAAEGEPKAIAPSVAEPAADAGQTVVVEADSSPEAHVEAAGETSEAHPEPEALSRAAFADTAHSEALIEPAPEPVAEPVPETPAMAEPAPEAAAVAAAGATAHEHDTDEGGHDGDEPEAGTGDGVGRVLRMPIRPGLSLARPSLRRCGSRGKLMATSGVRMF